MILFAVTFFLLLNAGICSDEWNFGIETSSSLYIDIVESAAFVDKTLMIKTFFKYDYVLFTAPRRSGKSTNLDMIKSFCEIPVHENGTLIPKNESETFKIFSTKNLHIYKREHLSFFHQHFGQYPVIYLDFKDLNQESFEIFLESFDWIINWTFGNNGYLMKSCALNEREKKTFETFLLSDENKKQNPFHLVESVRFLSHMLYKHYKRKVMIFVDEYDTVMQKRIYNSGYHTDKIIEFLRNFTSSMTIKNSYVEKLYLTSCLRQTILLTENSNVIHFPFAEDHPFNLYFGFTENEVIGLTKKFQGCEDKMPGIRELYEGYTIVNTDIKLYNVWSIVNFLESVQFEEHWIDSGQILNIKEILSEKNIHDTIEDLVNDKFLNVTVTNKISAKDIRLLTSVIYKKKYKYLSVYNNFVIFIEFLIDMGYLSVVLRNGNVSTLKIPNNEIRTYFKRHLYTNITSM